MAEHALEPLPLRQLDGDYVAAAETPFPYRNFTPAPLQEAPVAPPQPQVNRLEQLEKMLAEKHAFDESKEREAYDKAYMSGEKAGLALGQKRAEQILEKMQLLQDQAGQQLDEIRTGMCEAVLDIGIALAEWIVGEMTTAERGRLLAMAERASHSLPKLGGMVMLVHPADFAQFEKLIADSDFRPTLRTDGSIRPGSVRLANEEQDILIDPSASIAEAVAQLKKELLSGNGDAGTA